MNTEIKIKWIEALRSGEYKQGIGMLKNNRGSYCCLGVLCDLYQKETGIGEWAENDFQVSKEEWHDFIIQNKRESFNLPPNVVEWASLNSSNPNVNIADKKMVSPRNNEELFTTSSLGHLNDSMVQFLDIADIIEERL